MRSTRRAASLACGVPSTAEPREVCTEVEELGAPWLAQRLSGPEGGSECPPLNLKGGGWRQGP